MAAITFSKYVNAYQRYKEKNNLGEGVSRAEIKELRESFKEHVNAEKLQESSGVVLSTDDRIARAKALREKAKNKLSAATGENKDSRLDRVRAMREARKADALKVERNARVQAFREARQAKAASIVVREKDLPVNAKLNEARAAIDSSKKKLQEGDIPGAVDQAQMATQAVDAVSANQTTASPEVVALVKDLKAEIDNLATAVGVVADTGITPEADPNAAVPAQADQPLEPVQVQESKVIAEVRARIAERRAALAAKTAEIRALNENAGTDQIMAGMKASTPLDMSLGKVDKTETQLPKEITVKQAEKGTEPGVVRWPNKPITSDPANGQLGKGAVIKEAELPLDELHVERALHEEKLDFKKVFQNGTVIVG